MPRLRFGFPVLYAVAFTVLFVGVGATSDGWGLALGVTLAAFFVYWGFREEIEQHLTGPQEWGLFALAGVLVVVTALVESAELTDAILLSLVGVLGVSAVFGYRLGIEFISLRLLPGRQHLYATVVFVE